MIVLIQELKRTLLDIPLLSPHSRLKNMQLMLQSVAERYRIMLNTQRYEIHFMMNTPNWPLQRSHIRHYFHLIRFDRPIGTLLLLYPALTALVIAGQGAPSLKNIVIFSLGDFLMRSAVCAINDFADSNWDGEVSRTQDRPLAQRHIKPIEAVLIALLLTLLAFILVLFTNAQTVMLSFVAVGLASLYPFTKRFTHLPQIFLGAAFAWSIPMAFAAEEQILTTTTWLLFIATVTWTVAYDTMYAMTDRADDLRVGIKSTAILFGQLDRAAIGAMHLTVLILLYQIGQLNGYGFIYTVGLFTIALLFLHQQRLIRHRTPADCLQAFLNNRWVGLALLACTWLSYQIN